MLVHVTRETVLFKAYSWKFMLAFFFFLIYGICMAVKYDKRVTVIIPSELHDQLMSMFPLTSFSGIVRYLAAFYIDFFKKEVNI